MGYGDASNRGDNNSSMGDNLTAIDLGTNLKATDLILGRYHSCAILDNEKALQMLQKNCLSVGIQHIWPAWPGNRNANRGDNASEMGDNPSFYRFR